MLVFFFSAVGEGEVVFWGADCRVIFGFYETRKFLCDGGAPVGDGTTMFSVSSAVSASALVFFWRSCGVLWSVRHLAIFKRLRMVVV